MFLSCGDALFDLFSIRDHASASAPTAVTLSGNVGGSPMNVVVGLARLGHSTRYFTKLSSDVFGVKMKQYLSINKLDTSLCVDTDLNTTLAIVDTNEDGSANYVFYTDNTADVSITQADLPAQLPEDVKVLHFGSYSTAAEPTSSSLISLAEREKGKRFISYDPNLRTNVVPELDRWQESFRRFAQTATLIKASDEDISTLYGADAEDKFVADCFAYGAELVFITRGPDGSSGFNKAGQRYSAPGKPVKVVDTVGAGDTFQAAVLHHLATQGHISDSGGIQGDVALEDVVNFAMTAAAITCSRAGADMPWLSEL